MSLPDSIKERSICKIGKSNYGGTGIIVAPNKILTCNHVIEKLNEKIEISF
jgi:V8-like Glu-specific endopeptidase